MLSKSTRSHFDGTFKSCPKLFYQLTTVHGYFQRETIVGAFILLQNKNRDTYVTAFNKLKEIIIENSDENLMVTEALCDFEVALQTAIKYVFDKI